MGSRDEDWKRISAMAGLDEDGAILPPPAGLSISLKPSPYWKTTIYDHECSAPKLNSVKGT